MATAPPSQNVLAHGTMLHSKAVLDSYNIYTSGPVYVGDGRGQEIPFATLLAHKES